MYPLQVSQDQFRPSILTSRTDLPEMHENCLKTDEHVSHYLHPRGPSFRAVLKITQIQHYIFVYFGKRILRIDQSRRIFPYWIFGRETEQWTTLFLLRSKLTIFPAKWKSHPASKQRFDRCRSISVYSLVSHAFGHVYSRFDDLKRLFGFTDVRNGYLVIFASRTVYSTLGIVCNNGRVQCISMRLV